METPILASPILASPILASHILASPILASPILYLHYVKIMNEYLTHYTTNSEKYLKPANDNIYLLLNGLDTLTHVFRFLVLYTSDMDSVVANTRQAIFYYTQFIDQLDENIMYDLNLSSNSASLFVYKKTIWGLHKPEENNPDQSHHTMMIEIVNQLILIYRSIVDLFIPKPVLSGLAPVPVLSGPALVPVLSGLAPIPIESIVNKTTDIANALYTVEADTKSRYEQLVNVNFFIKNIKRYDCIYLFLTKYKHFHITYEHMLSKKADMDQFNDWPANKVMKWFTTTI
jgi:hypothetical protein